MKTRKNTKAHQPETDKWSSDVTQNSNALDLKENIFESKNAKKDR